MPAAAASFTWTGSTSGNWNIATNWSSNPLLPPSNPATELLFAAAGAGGTALTQNLNNPFQLNQITFDSNSAAYALGGNPLDFRIGDFSNLAHIVNNSSSAITINTPIVLTEKLNLEGTSANNLGSLRLNGALSGPGGIGVHTFDAVILGSAANTFTGPITVAPGVLGLSNGAAIPAGRDISVTGGASNVSRFFTAGLSNSAATALGTVTLKDAIFSIGSGNGDYWINKLVTDTDTPLGYGGNIDFTNSTSATLHFVNAGASITVKNAMLTGAGTSRIVNDTAAPLDITGGANTASVSSSARLANGALGQGFRVVGANTSLNLLSAGNTANFIVDGASILFSSGSSLGAGTFTLTNTIGAPFPGTLRYNRSTAQDSSAANQIILGPGGGRIRVAGPANTLILSGIISESLAGQGLLIAGDNPSAYTGILSLSGANTYSGPTRIGAGAILSIATFPDGGIAGPIGSSSNSPDNLILGGDVTGISPKLRYTGPTATSNRGLTFADAPSIIELTSASANLTLAGNIVGQGQLTKIGAGTLTLSGFQTHTAGASLTVSGGRLNLNSNSGIPAISSSAAQANLALALTGSTIALGADQDLRSVSIDTSQPGLQSFDLASHFLRVYPPDLAAAKTSLYALIQNARANPGDGIFDSTLLAHPSSGLGLAQLTDAHGESMIQIRSTRIGDVNLDGIVTIADFIDLASHFNQPGTWQEGDLNYDGQVTIADFIDLASNFNQSYSGESLPVSPQDQQMLSSFAASIGVSVVPEPASLSLLVFLGLFRRRGRMK